MSLNIGRLISRYSVVVVLPTLATGLIYADYTHTQEWKRNQANREK